MDDKVDIKMLANISMLTIQRKPSAVIVTRVDKNLITIDGYYTKLSAPITIVISDDGFGLSYTYPMQDFTTFSVLVRMCPLHIDLTNFDVGMSYVTTPIMPKLEELPKHIATAYRVMLEYKAGKEASLSSDTK